MSVATFPSSAKFSRERDQRKLFEQPEETVDSKDDYLDYYDSIEVTSEGLMNIS